VSEPSTSILLAALAFGYLLGSIPFGLLLTRVAGLGDIRAIGSNNIGATNVLRTGRKDLAAGTLVLDALKATAAVLIAGHWGHDAAIAAGLGAILGHLFPVWLGFKGGKGVATYIGILLAFAWPAALVFGAIWLAVAWITRFSSLSALVATALTPAVLWGLSLPSIASLFLLLTAIIWLKHHANIRRLLAGEETKIGASKSAPAQS
jgi:glycerol-3-phosphate acyltransferase PlsY